EGDDARVAARLGERHHGQRQLERARHRDDRDGLAADAEPLELVERAAQELVGQLAVEAGDDDANGAAAAGRLALDHAVADRDLELAAGVLRAAQARELVLFGRYLGLGLRLLLVGLRLVGFQLVGFRLGLGVSLRGGRAGGP